MEKYVLDYKSFSSDSKFLLLGLKSETRKFSEKEKKEKNLRMVSEKMIENAMGSFEFVKYYEISSKTDTYEKIENIAREWVDIYLNPKKYIVKKKKPGILSKFFTKKKTPEPVSIDGKLFNKDEINKKFEKVKRESVSREVARKTETQLKKIEKLSFDLYSIIFQYSCQYPSQCLELFRLSKGVKDYFEKNPISLPKMKFFFKRPPKSKRTYVRVLHFHSLNVVNLKFSLFPNLEHILVDNTLLVATDFTNLRNLKKLSFTGYAQSRMWNYQYSIVPGLVEKKSFPKLEFLNDFNLILGQKTENSPIEQAKKIDFSYYSKLVKLKTITFKIVGFVTSSMLKFVKLDTLEIFSEGYIPFLTREDIYLQEELKELKFFCPKDFNLNWKRFSNLEKLSITSGPSSGKFSNSVVLPKLQFFYIYCYDIDEKVKFEMPNLTSLEFFYNYSDKKILHYPLKFPNLKNGKFFVKFSGDVYLNSSLTTLELSGDFVNIADNFQDCNNVKKAKFTRCPLIKDDHFRNFKNLENLVFLECDGIEGDFMKYLPNISILSASSNVVKSFSFTEKNSKLVRVNLNIPLCENANLENLLKFSKRILSVAMYVKNIIPKNELVIENMDFLEGVLLSVVEYKGKIKISNVKSLQHLNFYACRKLEEILIEKNQKLKYLALERMGDLVRVNVDEYSTSSLRSFIISNCSKFDEKSVSISGSNFGNLELLSLENNQFLTDNFFQSFEKSDKLRKLIIKKCLSFRLRNPFMFKSIKIVKLIRLYDVTDEIFENFYGVEELEMEFCPQIGKIEIFFKFLKNLKSVKFRKMKIADNFFKYCKNLEVVDLYFCPHVTAKSFKNLPKLKYANFERCIKLGMKIDDILRKKGVILNKYYERSSNYDDSFLEHYTGGAVVTF